MDTDNKALLVSRLREWCGKPVVMEFRFGVSHISGICLLVNVSELQLQLQFEQSAGIGCECIVQLDDEIEIMTVQGFEEAAESILGKKLISVTAEDSSAFSNHSVEKVINARFRSGARLIIGATTSFVVEGNQLN